MIGKRNKMTWEMVIVKLIYMRALLHQSQEIAPLNYAILCKNLQSVSLILDPSLLESMLFKTCNIAQCPYLHMLYVVFSNILEENFPKI